MTRRVRGREAPFKTTQDAIVLSIEFATDLHSFAFSGIMIPVFSKLTVDAFYQISEQGKPCRA
jgi:hypothetical protein